MNRFVVRALRRLTELALTAGLAACGGSDAPTESVKAYLFLSPSDVALAPGQSIEIQVDIANLPTDDAAAGYAISLSEETSRIRIDSANCPPGTGTVSCRLWTIRPDTDAAPGDYAFRVRASGTFTPVQAGEAKISVVAFAQAKRAVVAASAQHVVTADGRLWAHGRNTHGQTGVGFESVGFDANAPFVLPDFIDAFVQVGTDTDWIAVVSAEASVIALKADGTVWGWGSNPPLMIGGAFTFSTKTPYQFGLPSARDIQLRPRQIPGLANIKAISAIEVVDTIRTGGAPTPSRFLALSHTGLVYGFGGGADPRYNIQRGGSLDFLVTDEPLVVPRSVTVDGAEAPLEGIAAIAGGVQNTGRGWGLALHRDGSVWQIGRRDTTFIAPRQGATYPYVPTAALPQRISGLPAGVVAVTVGQTHDTPSTPYSLVATTAGEVWSWTERDAVPRRVDGVAGVVEVDARGKQVSALDAQGRLWQWEFGSATAPQQVTGIPAMSRLANRGPNLAISGDCATAGRGRLWSVPRGEETGSFGRPVAGQPDDACAPQPRVTLTVAKIGRGTVSLDPVDGSLTNVCGVDCAGPLSVTVGQREAVRVRATAAAGWERSFFNVECDLGQPLLDADTVCTATFVPKRLEGDLTVEVSGGGRVTSTPAGIDCGTHCQEIFALGTEIRLTAVADPGFAFVRWSGPSHTNERDCSDGVVTMNVIGESGGDQPLKHCTAIFGPLPRLSVTPHPGGAVTSTPASIDCGATCTQQFAAGTVLTLSAVASADFRFDGFVEADCQVPITLTQDQRCTPVFTSIAAGALTVTVTGSGRVTSVPAGIDCGSDCSQVYAPGTDVTLTAVPAAGSSFTGWSGDCAGITPTVSITVAASRTCFAAFGEAGWQQVGSALAQGSFMRMAIAVDTSVASAPVVHAATAVFTAGRVDLLVRRFVNGAWGLVGTGPLNADELVSTELFTPAIAIDSGGQVSVAWAENGRRIRVKQWNGNAWISLAENLNVDPNALVFGTQIATSGSGLAVAWIEDFNNAQVLGRMAMKRYQPGPQVWTGGSVLPDQTTVLALRLTTEPLGQALLAFVPGTTNGSFEAPLRVIRESIPGVWNDVCTGLLRPPSTAGLNLQNVLVGFGVARSFASGNAVAVFNNGEAVFAVECRGGAWVGLDGSASGQVAAITTGEYLYGLSVARGEGAGVALAWTKVSNFVGGGQEMSTQVMNQTVASEALVPNAPPLTFLNGGFSSPDIPLAFLPPAGTPVLAGLFSQDGSVSARAYSYRP